MSAFDASSKTYRARVAHNKKFVDAVREDAERRGEELSVSEMMLRVDQLRTEHFRRLGRLSGETRQARQSAYREYRYPGIA